MFHQNAASKFTPKNTSNNSNKKAKTLNKNKKTEITRILLPIPPRPSKEVLKKSKFFQNKGKNHIGKSNNKDS